MLPFKVKARHLINKKDELEWITVRGAHIPLQPGADKEKTIKDFFAKKSKSQPKTKTSTAKGILSSYTPKTDAARHVHNTLMSAYKGSEKELSKNEAYAVKYVLENTDKALNAYKERMSKTYEGANNIISADVGKFSIPGMDASKSGDYHEAGSAISKLIAKELLENAQTASKPVLIMGGISGAGKSASLGKSDYSDYAAVFDTNSASSKGVEKKIKEIQESGRKAIYSYVHRDPIVAYRDGVISRMYKEDRIVPISIHVMNAKAYQAAGEMSKKQIKGLDIILWDNTGKKEDIAAKKFEELPKVGYNLSVGKLNDDLFEVVKKGYQDGYGQGEKHVRLSKSQVVEAVRGIPELERRAEQELFGKDKRENEKLSNEELVNHVLKQHNIAVSNAKRQPSVYYFKHIKEGVVGYDKEVLLVTTDALKRMARSFAGKPVYVHHQEVDLEQLQEKADGYVADCFYNEYDGSFWGKMVVVSDAGHEAVSKRWSVSNAYIPSKYGNSGYWHNIYYDKEVLDGEYTHLAIVPNPRYEDACIMSIDEYKEYCTAKKQEIEELKNSKSKGGTMFKIFKKKEVIEDCASEELQNAYVSLDDGTEVKLADAIDAVVNAKREAEEEEKKNACEKVNMDSEVDVDGEKMTVKELMNKYKSAMAKKNEDEEEKKEDDEKEKENEDEEEKKKEDEEQKENAKKEEENKDQQSFEALKNAQMNIPTQVVETSERQIARGRERY